MKSFYAPYLCESCGSRFRAVIDANLHRAAIKARVPPQVVCPNCGSDARYDGTAAAFASSAERLEGATTLVSSSAAVVRTTPRGGGRELQNFKRQVEAGETHLILQGELSSSVRWRTAFDGVEGPLVLDLSSATGVGAGAVAPLLTALRAPPPEISQITVRGAPLVVAQNLRASPAERLAIASVGIEGHCKTCNRSRRAIVPVEDGRWEGGMSRGVRCPVDGTRLEMNRTLQDVPHRRLPIQTMVFSSGALAVLGVLVVLVAGIMAASGFGRGDVADAAVQPLVIDERQVTVRGRGGPLGTEEEARTAARTSAVALLMSALNQAIGDRRGEDSGGIEPTQPQVDAFLGSLGESQRPTEVDSTVKETDGGHVVEATYGMSRATFDLLAERYAEEKAWGPLVLRRAFPPEPGLIVAKSTLAGVEDGVRVVKLGADPLERFDQLPVGASGAVLTIVDRDRSEREVRIP